MDFSALVLDVAPHAYLVCPPALCELAVPHRESPVYEVTAGQLQVAWFAVVAGAQRVSIVSVDEGGVQYDFVQQSAIMRYPDTITVRFLPWGEGRSTIAIYSRSTYGVSDFGVNQDRIDDWLSTLSAEISRLPD